MLSLLPLSNLKGSHILFPKQVLDFTPEGKGFISVHSKVLCKGKIHFNMSEWARKNENVVIRDVSELISANRMFALWLPFYQTKYSCQFIHL